jgi:GH15 family glucan-1,4-alpha-glucosidase
MKEGGVDMPERHPGIGEYAYLSDCHGSALVSRGGSIDWACLPRFDSASSFARLLDRDRGGFCRIAPAGPFESSRRYLDDSLVLETTFRTAGGRARLIDCFAMRKGGEHKPHRQLLRIVEGLDGQVDFRLECAPRFEYGAVMPWIRKAGRRAYAALGGSNGLLISGDFRFEEGRRHQLDGTCRVARGERARLSIMHRTPESLDEGDLRIPPIPELDRRLEQTLDWWRSWASKRRYSGALAGLAARSAAVLKGLCNAPTGAIVAAATTSLPESPGGSRNWDYRYSWIRDSCFAARSLAEIGFDPEADGFRRFVERSAAGSAAEIQVVFGVGGERQLREVTLENLEGYRGAKPVRIGNAAQRQVQLDIYGELLSLSWLWHTRGHSPDADYWEFLTDIVTTVARTWERPDSGIWEIRGKPRHFVHSKVMCWAALDYGIRLARELGREAPVDQWEKARDEVRQAVEQSGYDASRGVFVQAFGSDAMDAALLLIPTVGFADYCDERMVRTTDAVRAELGADGLLRRYAEGLDGLPGREGAFLACSFWLVNCLARQGRLEEAREAFRRAAGTGNDLGLFSEEYDVDRGEMLGNFPQGLTHLSLIEALLALTEAEAACPAEEEKAAPGRKP